MFRRLRTALPSRVFSEYGMLGVLLLLCAACTVGTIQQRQPRGQQAAEIVARQIRREARPSTHVVIVAEDEVYVRSLARLLEQEGLTNIDTLAGNMRQMRRGLEAIIARGEVPDVLATTRATRLMVDDVRRSTPAISGAPVYFAESYWWPTFLTRSNLLNVANRNVVIGVIAVGMTMVIITGGIDLSVGRLVALSAVVAAKLIVAWGGGSASAAAMLTASLAAIGLCGLIGGMAGFAITRFKIPPFIATLAVMWVADGVAFILSGGKSISDVPTSYDWLGMGKTVGSIPNTLVLMAIVYVLGHGVMSRTRLGRHIYAIGGNRQAAKLSGIRVNRVLMLVYTISAAGAGLGGVMLASQFRSGVANYGAMYELKAIAAVVVGGTSLAGGEGKILGTLIGVLIIAVVQNAMNLLEIGSYAQNVVLGLIVLTVVLLDTVKRHGWRRLWQPE